MRAYTYTNVYIERESFSSADVYITVVKCFHIIENDFAVKKIFDNSLRNPKIHILKKYVCPRSKNDYIYYYIG